MHTEEVAARILEDLERDSVQLWVEGPRLRYSARRGVVNGARQELLKANKQNIIALLRERTGLGSVLDPEAILWEPAGQQTKMAANPDVWAVPCLFLWKGVFDPGAAQAALDELLARHGILRTHYARDPAGKLLAITSRTLSVPARVIDLRSLQPEARQARAFEIGESLIRNGAFDPFRGPLVACAVMRLEDDLTAFVVAAHHSLCDALSARVVTCELRTLYAAALGDPLAVLPPVGLEYRDYVRQRTLWLQSAEAEPHIAHWREVAAGSGTLFDLPHDRKEPPDPEALRPDVVGCIGADALAGLRRIAVAGNTTMFAVFTALLCTVQAEWGGKPEGAAWVCHSGRYRADLEQMVGCLIDNWLLRVDLSGDPDFLEIVRRVHRCCVEGAAHLAVTLECAGPEIAKVTTLRAGLCINFMPLAAASSSGPGFIQPWGKERMSRGLSRESKIGLVVNCSELEKELCWTIEYASYLFEDSTMDRYSKAVAALAARVAADPGVRPGTLRFMQP